MMTCEYCYGFKTCLERRGICRSFVLNKARIREQKIKKAREDIEVLNQKYRASAGAKTDKADEGVHQIREDGPEEIRGREHEGSSIEERERPVGKGRDENSP